MACMCLAGKEFPEMQKTSKKDLSANFMGNYWRFKALYELSVNKKLNQGSFFLIDQQLRWAEESYLQDESEWGLGLTYNLLG